MTEQYPVPHYAANIWLAGDKIMLGLPETKNTPGRTLALPKTDKGLAAVIAILKERMTLPQSGSTIGTKAEPTQFDLDKAIKEYTKRVTLDSDPDEALRQLGLL